MILCRILHGHGEHSVVAGDTGPLLLVLCLGVADTVELWGRSKHGASEPDSETLHVVADNVDIDVGGLGHVGQVAEASNVLLHAL